MAGDWIKMRGNLWDDPRVAKLCDLTGQSEAAIIGGLYWLWATADQHTEDGCMPGLTLRQIDRKTGIQGFGAGLCAIGWLHDDEQGVVLAKFEEHNGTSAKRRCTDAQRKANSRNVSASDADIPPTDGGQEAPNLGAREEKRREEEKDISKASPSHPPAGGKSAARFEEFWLAWPKGERKQDRKACAAKWKLHGFDLIADVILADVRLKRGTRKWAEGFIEAPLVYLNNRRWEDGVVPGEDSGIDTTTAASLARKRETEAFMAEQDEHQRKLQNPEEQARIAAIRERARGALKVVA